MASWLEAQIDKEKNRAEGKRLAFLQQLKAKRAGIGMQQIIPQPQYDLPQTPQWTPSPAIDVAQQPILMSQNVMTSPEVQTWQPRYTPQMPVSPTVERPQVSETPTPSDVAWYDKPKDIWGGIEEKLGEGISKVPILPKALEKIAPVFSWIHENLEKPFAAIITSPFSPDLAWKKGESYKDHAKREYDAWEAPSYVKGAAEFAMPLWWMPWFGWAKAGSKAIGIGGKAAAAMAKSGKALTVAEKGLPAGELLDNVLFRASRLRAAMEHVPVVNKIVKAVGGEGAFITQKEAQRVAGLTRGKVFVKLTERDALIKTKMELVKAGFISDMRNGVNSLLVPKLQVLGKVENILGMDSKGVIANVVDRRIKYTPPKGMRVEERLYHGTRSKDLSTFIDKEGNLILKPGKQIELYGRPAGEMGWDAVAFTPEIKIAKQFGDEFVFEINPSALQKIGRGLNRTDIAEHVIGTSNPIKIPKGEWGIVGSEKFKLKGQVVGESSQYLYDVLEGAIKNPDNYNFLTKEVKVYVDTLKAVLDDVYALARKEGLKVPKDTMLHRIVKGKTGKVGYEASEYGSQFEVSRTHKLMREGVEAGVDYGLDVNESISSTVNHYMREISRRRFNNQVGKLGITPKRMWSSSPEGQELKRLRDLGEEGILKYANEIEALSKQRSDFLKHYSGRQIIGEGLAKFSEHPVFKKSLFPKDVVKTTEKILNDDSQKWLSQSASVSGLSRMMTAAMDLSAPFIQGAAVWGRNPLAWAKGVKNMLEFAIKPENYYKYLDDPIVNATRMERIMAGGSSSTFEYFKALAPLQKQAGRLPGVGKGIQKGIAESWGRAETAFTGFGEVARNEMWKALKKPGMTAEALTDLTRTIDRMTGVMSTEALAIGRTQQDFENAFVFFAPRYTRAGLAFVSDALKGGMAGAEARKSLGSLMASGVAYYYGACKILGQQPNFDPSSSRFMTIKVGNSHVGVGGIMTAMLRLGYDIGVTAVEDPINLIKPLSQGHLNRWDNPFVKFMYSRTAPLTSALYGGVIENTNYFGEPLESVEDWGKFMLDKVTPIATQEMTEYLIQGGKMPEATSIVAEFGGLRRFPKSPWELLDEERDSKAMTEYGQPYDNLNDLQQTKIDKGETIRKLQTDVDAQTVTRGDAVSVGFLNRQRERDSARQVYEGTLWKIQEAYDDGVIDGIQFRKEMANAGYGLGTTYEHIDSQPEYKDVLKKLQEPRKLTDKHIEDIAYAEFMDNLYKSGEFEDKYGLFQYDKYNAYIESFKAKYGDEIYQYVLDQKAERDANLPPLAKEYQIAKEVMKPYWAVKENIIRMFGQTYADSNAGERMITKLRQQIRMGNAEIERFYQLFYAQQ
uniref:Uncharacterized protein n=1 Tax=viral metagenome TaxID=1070528 RepID=A0A6H1ZSX8_9ZZZZ